MKAFLRCHTLGIQARLTMLALVTALPLVALVSFAILRTVDDQRAQMQRDVRESVEDLLADVDRQISSVQAELQVLAVSPSLQAGDFQAFDQFQGQEAAVVLISMATSSGDDLPRQIEFLYSRNRLNVAISRARCLAIIVAPPRLPETSCPTIEQLRLVNSLCWAKNFGDGCC